MLTRARFITATAGGVLATLGLAGCSVLGIEDPAASGSSSSADAEKAPAGQVDFDSMIVTVDTDPASWQWEQLQNPASADNGLLVVALPVTADNQDSSNHVISPLYVKVTAPDGTQQADLTASYPDDILTTGSVSAGQQASGMLHVLFRGKGTYTITFDNLLGGKSKLKLDIDSASTGMRAIPATLGAHDMADAFAAGASFDMEGMTLTLSADVASYCWAQASAPGDPVWDGRWCVGVPLTVENHAGSSQAVTQDIYAKFDPSGRRQDDPAAHFAAGPYESEDGVPGTADVGTIGLIAAGQSTSTMIWWVYEGDGDYYVAFDSDGAKVVASARIAQYDE